MMYACERVPQPGEIVDRFCDCGHLLMIHGKKGCAACQVLQEVHDQLDTHLKKE